MLFKDLLYVSVIYIDIFYIYAFSPVILKKIQRDSHMASNQQTQLWTYFCLTPKPCSFYYMGTHKPGETESAKITLNKKAIVKNVKLES